MDWDKARLAKARLLNAVKPAPEPITLPYDEVLRAALLLSSYEGGWSEGEVIDVLHWWRALKSALPHNQGWVFTLRDLEPMWLNEKESGDFLAVYVTANNEGHKVYEVVSHHEGAEYTSYYADIHALEIALTGSK